MKRYTLGKRTLLKLVLAFLVLNFTKVAIGKDICNGVVFLPTELIPTGAKDLGQQTFGDETRELIDVHTYNHFYTFQVDRDATKLNEGIEMKIPAEKFQTSTSEGFALRLRAEFNSAEGSRTEMGFRIMLQKQNKEQSVENKEKEQKSRITIAEASSLDQSTGEGTVIIDVPSLPSGEDYIIRYEFYMKEVIRRGTSLSMEEDTIASRDALIQCNLPFFTQELTLIDRKVLKSRVRKYTSANSNPDKDIGTLSCDFSQLQAKDKVEGGLDCKGDHFSYKIEDHVYQSVVRVHKLAEFSFKVSGEGGRSVTQYFQLNIGTEFAFGAGLRAVLRRVKKTDKDEDSNPFACLLDQSCQISKRNEKNHVSLNVVLTSGEYKLQFFEQTNDAYSRFMFNDLGLEEIPITIDIEAFPIVQNEERSTCPYMYLTQDFIQFKFIEGQKGQRFVFSDKIVLDLVTLEQRITIFPEQDSYLKVNARQAFGVNLLIELCDILDNGESQCGASSQQIGTTELLVAEVKKNSKHFIRLSYLNSVLAFHSFTECPHIIFEMSMISQSEAKIMDQNLQTLADELEDSQKRLESTIFNFSTTGSPFKLKNPEEATYSFDIKPDESFQIVTSHFFSNDVKFGIFVEIFSSPFQPEVLGLFLESISNNMKDGTDTEVDGKAAAKEDRVDLLDKYKNNKIIWVDLEPGYYRLQVVCTKQTEDSEGKKLVQKRQESKSVKFQLYMDFEFINVAREAFIPANLNYFGLLGYEEESKDFGQITLFYDDVTLYKDVKFVAFMVQSEMASLSIQLEQQGQTYFKIVLQVENEELEKKKWKKVGQYFSELNYQQSIQTIEMELLDTGKLYRIAITRDIVKTDSSIETAELGERYGHSFSLKIELSENDDESLAELFRRQVTESMPASMEEIAKVKLLNPGMKEAAFKMGNRDIVALLESEDGLSHPIKDQSPYLPKDSRIYQTNENDRKIITSIPFQVTTDSEIFFAGIYEYTEGANLLSLVIYEDQTHQEVAFSNQGRYYSRIDIAILPKGSYYLVVRNDKSEGTKRSKKQAPIKFLIDVMRQKISERDQREWLEALQLCPLPDSPSTGLNKIGYVHPLSGNSMQSNMLFKMLELDSGALLPLKISEPSLVTAYIEVSENIEVSLSIKETGGLRKIVAFSSDQDSTVSNFLKQKGFVQRNVVSLRAVLNTGTYWIEAKANSFENSNVSFDQKENFCQTYLLSLTVSSTKSATEPFFQNTDEEYCNSTVDMANKLVLDQVVHKNFVADLSKQNNHLAYFDFLNEKTQGPYLFYFQLDYDLRQEGPVALVLSQYDQETLQWKEVSLFMLSDSQSLIMRILDIGTYGISIQPIASTKDKFDYLGLRRQQLHNSIYFASTCFQAKYTYFITTINTQDNENLNNNSLEYFMNNSSTVEIVRNILAMEAQDDMRDLQEFAVCQFDQLPQSWPEDGNFEIEITPKMESSKFEIIDFIVPQDSYLKVMVSVRNPLNKIQIEILDKLSKNPKTLGTSDFKNKQLSLVLEGRKKAYHMKFIYSFLDENDACPVYDLHVALKPLEVLLKENLLCESNKQPENLIQIKGHSFRKHQTYAFSGEYLEQLQDHKFDITVELEHSDYMVDLELKSDFLTANMEIIVYFENPSTQTYHSVAISTDVLDVQRKGNIINQIDNRNRVQRLKYLEETDEGVDLSTSSKLLMRIQFEPVMYELLKNLKEKQLYNEKTKPVCFNFDFSLVALESKQQQLPDTDDKVVAEEEKQITNLVRVDWDGQQVSNGKYLADQKIMAYLEFDQSITHQTMGKIKNQAIFYLTPYEIIGSEFKYDSNAGSRVLPSSKSLAPNDNGLIRLQFKSGSLKHGQCYKFEISTANSYINISPEQKSDSQMSICISKCFCSDIGSSSCNEVNGKEPVCICRANYIGLTCDECASGYIKNDKGACVKGNYCKEDGGEEDCNGHGDCLSNGGNAKCICHEGFANDGLDLCARCADPLFAYPHECQHMQRQYAIFQENYECSKLPYQMPKVLFDSPEQRAERIKQAQKDGSAPPEQTTIYENEGILDWAGRYSLISNSASHNSASSQKKKKTQQNENSQMRKISVHEFLVPNTSIFRLFLNTLNSGASVRYAIFDSNGKLLLKNDEFSEQLIEFDKLNPVMSETGSNDLTPFKLVIEYQSEVETTKKCPMVEIHFILSPYYFQSASLKCSNAQQLMINKFDSEMEFTSENKFRQEKVILSSKQLEDDGSTYPWLRQDSEYVYLKIKMTVKESGHAFSVLTAYKLANLHTILTLKDHQERTLFVEQTGLLGEIPESSWVYKELPSSKNNAPITLAPDLSSRDLVSFIEINEMAAGMYTLEIGIPKGYFFKNSQYNTCLDFDLVLEYISRKQLKENQSKDDDGNTPIQMVGITPLGQNDLTVNDKLAVTIIFDQEVDSRSIAFSQSDLNKICQLQYTAENGQTTYINPEQIFLHQNFAKVNFDFTQHEKALNQLFISGLVSVCFNLVCGSQPGKDLKEIIVLQEIQNYKYCFKELKQGVASISMCNGYAKPRFENGQCICTFPYKGQTCDECEQDFETQEIKFKRNDKELMNIACIPKQDSQYQTCNGFGTYMKSRRSCKCDQRHAGDFCEMCKDPDKQFPDCKEENQSNVVDSGLLRQYEKRRRNQVYNIDDQLDEKLSNIFRQQCPLTNYPTFLNEIQNHKEFESGNFHISDTFITNHDADNVISFTPRHLGSLKILVKQPESYQSVKVDEALDIEIGVAIQGEATFFLTEQNFDIDFKGKLQRQRADFTVLYLDVTEKLFEVPLLLFFRGMNYTHDDITSTQNLCQTLYIEIEFRSKDSSHKCFQDYPNPSTKKNALTLQRNNGIGVETQRPVTFEDNGEEGFFFYQDYFIDQDNEAGYDLTVSLDQKFADEVTIVPIIEIKGTELEDLSVPKSESYPDCTIFCEIAGHKSYNQMTLNTVVPFGTLFRVWLYKKASNKKVCLNYELIIKHKSLSNSKDVISAQGLTCEHLLDLPESFNTGRYLGVDEQEDFEYVENFKIENQSSNVNIKFKLQKDTLVRFQGIQHKQIKFNLSLLRNKQVLGLTLDKQLPLDQGVHEPESNVFAALAPGEYKLKIQFINSQMEAISQPCQSIQLHIAMAKINNTQTDAEGKFMPVSFDNLLSSDKMSHSFQYVPMSIESNDRMTGEAIAAYDILFQGVFSLEDKEGINLLIKSTCDFLRLDISFILVNNDTKHVYSPQSHSEDKKKLLVLDMPSGHYKLIIYARKCDVRTNEKVLKKMAFKMSMHLYSFDEKQHTQISIIPNNPTFDSKKIHVIQDFISPDQLLCKEKYRHLPENLIEDNLSYSLDFEMHFSVTGEELVFSKTKIITYSPPPNKDALRIQIAEGIQIRLFQKSEYNGGVSIAQSTQILGSQYAELVAQKLKIGSDYIIELFFEGEQFNSCVHSNMQVLIASSEELKCVGKDKIKSDTTIALSRNDSPLAIKIASSNPQDIDATPSYVLILKEDKTDLEVSLDYSNTLYGSRLVLYRQLGTNTSKTNTNSENQKLLNQVAESESMKLKPSSINNLKHQTRYLFNNLAAGSYSFKVFQPSKLDFTDNCHDLVTGTFKASPSIDSFLEESNIYIHQALKFSSKMPDSESIRKVPVSLPLDLNSFKYLGGGDQEKKYILVSDMVELQSDDQQNKIMLEVTQENTKVRVYYEDTSLTLHVYLDEKLQSIPQNSNNLVQFNAKVGKYALYFKHFTEQAKNRRLYLKDLVQVTILVAEPSFVKSQYEDYMKDGLKGCEESQFPLALAKNTQFNVADEQSYYNYPLLRQKSGYDQTLAQYSFRFNETQRVYFEVGSNFVQSHAVLKLTPKSSKGKQFTVGRQSGNVNILDTIVPPGDYQIVIVSYVFVYDCGIFSLRGLLNQKSAMIEGLPENSDGFMQGTSQCQVKGDPAPTVIYQNKAQTSQGNEEYINDDGSYFKAINDVLIVKSHGEVLQPWVQEIEIQSAESSILKVVIQSDVAEKMSVKLIQSYASASSPTFQNLRQVQTGFEVLQIKELSYIFTLNPNIQYFVQIDFYGDMYDQDQQENDCAYFNLVLSIQSLSLLHSQLLCNESSPLSKMGDLKSKLPLILQEGKDFNEKLAFEEKGIYKLNYPEDFNQLKYGSDAIMVSQKIQAQNAFYIEGEVFFELPFSDWQLSLYNIPAVENQSAIATTTKTAEEMMLQIELTAEASLLQRPTNKSLTKNKSNFNVVEQQTNMRRAMERLNVKPEKHEKEMNLLIIFQESQASGILKSVSEYAKSKDLPQNLCLPVGIQLTVKSIEKTKKLKENAKESKIIAFKLMHGGSSSNMQILETSQNQDSLPLGTKYVNLVVQLSREPLDDPELKNAFFLNVLSQQKLNEVKINPVNIKIDHDGAESGYGYIIIVSFELNLKQLVEMKTISEDNQSILTVSILADKIYDKENNPKTFKLSEQIQDQISNWSIPIQPSEEQKMKNQVKRKDKGEKMKDEILETFKQAQQNDTTTIVDCKCVHGKCKQGQSTCEKCDQGFQGVLCDIPNSIKKREKVKIEDQEEIDDVVFKKIKPKSKVQELEEEDKQDRESSKKPKYTEIKTPSYQSEPQEGAISLQALEIKQGLMEWLFFGFVELVKKSLYFIALVIGFFLLKFVFDKIPDVQREQIAKERKQGRKKQESDYEGVNFSDGDGQGDDESGLVSQPIELTTIKPKTKKKKRSQEIRKSLGSFNSAADSDSEEEQQKKLKLFEQDQPMSDLSQKQPQDSSISTSNQFNPFEEQVPENHESWDQKEWQESYQPESNGERQGDAIINEIDDALNDLSGSDDGGEYQSFV